MPQAATKRAWAVVFPGGLLLIAVAILFAALHNYASEGVSVVSYIACSVFSAGLLLSAIFQRSRVFFVLLILGVADVAVTLGGPHLTAQATQCLVNLTALLVCANLLLLASAHDRGILTPWGRWQMALIAGQVAGVALISATIPAQAAALLTRAWLPAAFFSSQLGQLPFLLLAITLAILLVREWKRRTAVGSGIMWALAAAGFGLAASPLPAGAAAGFAASATILAIAVLENSYGMAFLDELTALPGRRSFNEALLKLGDEYAIAMVDVDHFKLFNDMFGHAAGDQVLQMVAGKLAGVGGGGSAFRYGGEEFAVIFPRAGLEDAFPVLEELRERIERVQFRVRGEERRKRARTKGPIPRSPDRRRPSARARRPAAASAPTNITVSIGVAEYSGSESPEIVVRAADKALYRAKQQGRNRVVASFERSRAGALT